MLKKKQSANLEQMQAEFEEFFYRVAHDLNTSARLMVEFSHLLQSDLKGKISADNEDYLSIIVQNGTKLQLMLEGLQRYLQINIKEDSIVTIDSEHLTQDCIEQLRTIINNNQATVIIDKLPEFEANPVYILKVFILLLENSLKFHSPDVKPNIQVSAVKNQQEICFCISDNGLGIDKPFQELIFKIFERLHTDEEYPGVGVGLTLAQKIVEQHGGKIWCESQLGIGTKIYFTLPVDRSE